MLCEYKKFMKALFYFMKYNFMLLKSALNGILRLFELRNNNCYL